MGVFSDAQEVYDNIGRIFEEALAHPEVGDILADSGVVLGLRMSEPDSTVTIDMPNRVVDCGDTDLEPNMTIKAKADVAHDYWLGNVNVAIAIARGQMRVRGPVPKLVELAAAAKPVFPMYQAFQAAKTEN